jgi:hypothetical protein
MVPEHPAGKICGFGQPALPQGFEKFLRTYLVTFFILPYPSSDSRTLAFARFLGPADQIA